ncbi:uncharacterized protein LOC124924460 [Impatiens glandulifera]|uniref:uncharacterized protein LOC124924460 n=1 Tax=Impatiens glandulifera TaxID=253017 RepID=UPI001FB10C2F|nr:uncharacterized protein LOC124924460 [Impatiens glandulifera]
MCENLSVVPGKVLVPPVVVDHIQGQALDALQIIILLVLVSCRSKISKVYLAMYIKNVTELSFDDVTPEDSNFPSIQGLAETGLISSKLSRHDLSSSLEDDENINKINPDAWPAIAADVAVGEQGIIALAFGYTRLFHPEKPVTKVHAAIALATIEASEIVNGELARINVEALVENSVTVHNALVVEIERDVNATFEKKLLLERQKIDALDKMAEEARIELERLRAERELEGLLSNKVEILYMHRESNALREKLDFNFLVHLLILIMLIVIIVASIEVQGLLHGSHQF